MVAVSENELKQLKNEESQPSDTDITEIRKKWAEEQGMAGEEAKEYAEKRAVRNHGLFSKPERALQIAGWGESACNDIEIFKLVDTEGLTPLLMVLMIRTAFKAQLVRTRSLGTMERRMLRPARAVPVI